MTNPIIFICLINNVRQRRPRNRQTRSQITTIIIIIAGRLVQINAIVMPSLPRRGTMDARAHIIIVYYAHTTYWLSTASVRASPSTGSSDVGDGRRSVFISFFVERRSRGVIIKKVSVAARTDADGRRRRSGFEI